LRPPGSSARAPARRTQSERRAETRGRLLDATIESLLDVGYAGTTIRRVTELAGVSQGAQSHYFPHRVDLVASAFEQLAERREARYTERARELPDDPSERIRALLDLLWEDFSSELFTVALKLWIAAAEDDELRERLVPVERRIYQGLAEVAAEVAGPLANATDFDRRLAVATNTVAGLALVRGFDPSGRASKGNQWPYHRAALEGVMLGR
jgi:AcrR family transcriptional regulator